MNQRCLLCLLICGVMLYYAVPRISPGEGGAEGIFAVSWIGAALLVIAGNLAGILYSPKKRKAVKLAARPKQHKRMHY